MTEQKQQQFIIKEPVRIIRELPAGNKKMKPEDKKIIQETALATADAAVASFDTVWQSKTQLPIAPFTLCWELSKAVYGSVMKLRGQRALEFVQMVEENQGSISPEVWSDEGFQDGFVYALEKYLTERNRTKRELLKNIFLGFATASDRENFILEKLAHTVTQIGTDDIEVLKDVDPERQDNNYQIYDSFQEDKVSNIYSLLGAGILVRDEGAHLAGNGNALPFVKLSHFGKEFIKYLAE
jgi:hypothetical protein